MAVLLTSFTSARRLQVSQQPLNESATASLVEMEQSLHRIHAVARKNNLIPQSFLNASQLFRDETGRVRGWEKSEWVSFEH